MENTVAINIINLTKRYKIDGKDFYALKNLNLSIEKGALLGIIGENGAGKSTLLRILAEIIPPTEGSVELNGQLLSILEVGSGFHKDLSGHENIYFNAALYGKTKSEIDAIYNDIVEFSGVKDFINEPVKTYSNGMYLRLAMSIILFLDFDIVLFDEVINVGDAAFRHKSLQLILDKVNRGKTCILVSHDINAIANICNSCIVLKGGEIVFHGTSKAAIEEYLKVRQNDKDIRKKLPINHPLCVLEKITIDKTFYNKNDNILLSVEYFAKTNEPVYLVFVIQNHFGKLITDSQLFRKEQKEMPIGRYEVTCLLPTNYLNEGNYSLDIFMVNNNKSLISLENAIHFEIKDMNSQEKAWHKITELVPLQINSEWRQKKISSF